MKKFKFIDLFSGIGGFHQALGLLSNGECVFASEIDKECIKTYYNNYNVFSGFDITKVNVNDIPEHDVLTGGFPCQAFSKAGKQEGLKDTRGTLFFEIQRILESKKTKYILLENVRNLVSHDNGKTYKIIINNLKILGYRLNDKPIVLSPHQFGIPQFRERVYILGIYDPKNVDIPININQKKWLKKEQNSVFEIINKNESDSLYKISEYEEYVLNVWNEFYEGIKEKIIGFPIWFNYLNSTKINLDDYPLWKQSIIKKNQNLYNNNKAFIDSWTKKHNNLNSFVNETHKKLEWQAGNSIKSIWEGLIQFRPSGIRVKKPDVFPTLVAMVQIPIIGPLKRRLSVSEALKLQSFSDKFKPSANKNQAYKQLGNSVNVKVVKFLFDELLKNDLK